MKRSLRYVSVAGLVLATVLACRHFDLGAVGAALQGAKAWPFAPVIAILVVARTAARARRTQLVLAGQLTFRAVVRLALAGCAAATLVPGPSEGVLWCTQLAGRHGFSLRALARFQVTDKALVAGSLGLVALALLPGWLAVPIGAAAVGAIAIGARRLLVPLGWLVASHVLSVAMIWLCLGAVGVAATPTACVALFLGTCLAGMVSIVPAQIGPFESAFAVLSAHHGLPATAALAAAVLYHVADVVPTTLAGLPALVRMSWRTRRASATGGEATFVGEGRGGG